MTVFRGKLNESGMKVSLLVSFQSRTLQINWRIAWHRHCDYCLVGGVLTDTGRALVDRGGGDESKVNVAIFEVLRRNECQ